MPIYAYRCVTCGHAQDVLQKMSDAVLSVCPACGAATYEKQVTAAGFQLKGSGWYVTDFRGGSTGAPKKDGEKAEDGKAAESASEGKPADKPAEASGDKPAAAPAAVPATPAAAPAATPKPAAAPPSGGR